MHCTKNHIFKSWDIKESSKRPSKYHLFINFFAEKKTVFPIIKKFKNFSVISKYHLSINFLAQKNNRIFHLRKFQNKNFLVTSKHGIPY